MWRELEPKSSKEMPQDFNVVCLKYRSHDTGQEYRSLLH